MLFRSTEFVHQQLIKQKQQGKSVILISADLDELLSLSDRIAVMFAGKIVGILDREEADVFKIGLLMGGVTGQEESGSAGPGPGGPAAQGREGQKGGGAA